jgi:predicted transcriptional regulator
VLAENPTISKRALAAEAGISRAAVYMYLATMKADVMKAATQSRDVLERSAMTHLDLIDRLKVSTIDIESVISELRVMPMTTANASAVFRGYSVLEKHHRLIGELLGEVSPPTTNVYLTQVQALLSRPVDPATLPLCVVNATRAEGARGPAD